MQTRQCRSVRTRASKRVATMLASAVAGVMVCGYGQKLFLASGDRQADSRAKIIMRGGVNELAAAGSSDDADSGLNPKYVSSNYVADSGLNPNGIADSGLNPKYVSSNYVPGHKNYRQQQGQRVESSPVFLIVGAIFVASAAMILNSSMMTTQGSAVNQAFDDEIDSIRTTKEVVSLEAIEPEMKRSIVTTTESPAVFRASAPAADTRALALAERAHEGERLKNALANVEKIGLTQNEVAAVKAALK